jgi:hypothetical protein
MKMEDIVRKQHELEDRIARFQEQINEFMRLSFRYLDTREHEIAIARLYDLMTEATDDATRIDHMFKGLLLNKTYSRRKAGERPSFLSRLAPSYGLGAFIGWQFDYPIPLTEQLAHDWAAGNAESTRRLLAEKNN